MCCMSLDNIQILKWLVLIILSTFVIGDNICQTPHSAILGVLLPAFLSQSLCLIFKHLNLIQTEFYFRICYEVGIYWLFLKMVLSNVLTLLVDYFVCFPLIDNVSCLFL